MSVWSAAETVEHENDASDDLYVGEYEVVNGIKSFYVFDTDNCGRQIRRQISEEDSRGKKFRRKRTGMDSYCSIILPKISLYFFLHLADTMPKNQKIAYEVRKKLIPGTSLFFTGVINVPDGNDSGVIHRKICDVFEGNQANIRGLENKAKLDESYESLEDDVKQKVLTEKEMPTVCWQKIQVRQGNTEGHYSYFQAGNFHRGPGSLGGCGTDIIKDGN